MATNDANQHKNGSGKGWAQAVGNGSGKGWALQQEANGSGKGWALPEADNGSGKGWALMVACQARRNLRRR